ncbi:MAG TPA: EamA family transporter [Streptosporangiaceae bacterium]|nr:EamA family transporter [Streptosporangiaceae bacterium]
MSATALVLIAVAAIAHATWNLFSKQASAAGRASFVWLMSATAAVVYAPVAAVSVLLNPPRLSALAWVFIGGTGLLQAGYFLFLQAGYRAGDLSLVYPVGRGTGALLAALAGIALLGERPGPAGIAGIGCVVIGLVVLGTPPRAGSLLPPGPQTAARPMPAHVSRALLFAVVTGGFIASYTLWDKFALTALHVPPLVQGYASLPTMAVVLAAFAVAGRDRAARTAGVWRRYRAQVIGAAVLSPLAYILVLTALSFTAVSAIAPAREVSVLAGVLLGRRLLAEGSLARRLAAAAAIVAGVICIALG